MFGDRWNLDELPHKAEVSDEKTVFKSLCFRKAYCVLVFFASNILGIPDKRSEILINSRTLFENLSDDANAYLYVTKISTISLLLTKLYVT